MTVIRNNHSLLCVTEPQTTNYQKLSSLLQNVGLNIFLLFSNESLNQNLTKRCQQLLFEIEELQSTKRKTTKFPRVDFSSLMSVLVSLFALCTHLHNFFVILFFYKKKMIQYFRQRKMLPHIFCLLSKVLRKKFNKLRKL